MDGPLARDDLEELLADPVGGRARVEAARVPGRIERRALVPGIACAAACRRVAATATPSSGTSAGAAPGVELGLGSSAAGAASLAAGAGRGAGRGGSLASAARTEPASVEGASGSNHHALDQTRSRFQPIPRSTSARSRSRSLVERAERYAGPSPSNRDPVPALDGRVTDGEVQRVVAAAHAGVDVQPLAAEHVGHRLDLRCPGAVHRRRARAAAAAVPRVLEELAQQPGAARARARAVDLLRVDAGEDGELLPRARHGDVQAPLAAAGAERTVVHAEPVAGVRRVADAEEDLVPLVALHVLQVLHEEGLHAREVPVDLGVDPRLVEQVEHELLLGDVERDDPEGALARLEPPEPVHEVRDQGLGLGAVRPAAGAAAALVHPLDPPPLDPEVRGRELGGREDVEPALVDVAVAELDERLVAAPVVPPEPLLGDELRDRLVEDALELHHVVVLRQLVLRVVAREEPRGRHLAGVADDEHLAPARDRADRLLRADLARPRRTRRDRRASRRRGGTAPPRAGS